jgi:hypothetical protein
MDMGFTIDIFGLISAIFWLGIIIIGWFIKDKMGSIKTGIEKVTTNLSELKEQVAQNEKNALERCSNRVQGIYKDMYKRDYVDTIKQDVDKLETRFNAVSNGHLNNKK